MIKKLFKYIGVGLCSLALVFGSFFVTKNNTKNYLSASADSVDSIFSYQGKELFFLDTVIVLNGNSAPQSKCFLNTISFSGSDSISISFGGSRCVDTYSQYGTINDCFMTSWNSSNIQAVFVSPGSVNRFKLCWVVGSPEYWTPVYIKCDSGFNCDVISLTLNSVNTSSAFYQDFNYWFDSSGNTYKINQLIYTDSNGKSLTFQFFTYSKTALSERTYYIKGLDSLSDSQQYNLGFQNGLADNQQNIFQKGYDAGYDNGFENGRSEGILSANDYSFTSLMGSVIDAPVKVVTSLLNFNILGVNLLDFALGIFSIALIVTIIRLTKGG